MKLSWIKLFKSETQDLKKAPVEYITDPQETHKKIPKLNETYPIINKVNLPNGLVYQQHMKSDFMGPVHVHHLYHPNSDSPVAEVITRPDPNNEMNHMVFYSQVSPEYKGRGLGKQAYLAALVHGKGIGRLLSDKSLSQNAHKAWVSFKGVKGLGGKIGKYATQNEGITGNTGKYNIASEDQHQVFVKNKKGLDYNALFPSVDIGDGVKETKLAASEDSDLKKAPVVSEEYEDIILPRHPKDEGRYVKTLTHKETGTPVHVIHTHSYGDHTGSIYYITENGKPDGKPISRAEIRHINHKSGHSYDPHFEAALTETKYRGKGLNTITHLAAIKDYGKIKSDWRLSPGSQKTYQKLSQHPNVKAKLYPTKEFYSEKDKATIFPQDTQHELKWQKPKKLAASEDLNKSRTFKTGVSGVSSNIGLERLKQIKQDHYVGAGGKDYDPDELHQRMFEISEKQAAKQSLFPKQESEKTHGSFEQMAPPMPNRKMFGKSDLIPPMIEKSGDDYRDLHTAPREDDSPLHNLTEKGTFPSDIYSHKAAHLYGHGDKAMDQHSVNVIHSAKNNPEAIVTMYRAVPKHIKSINPGDWVSINPQYAKNHGEARLGVGNYNIITKKVKAKHLFNHGDIHEWGYNPLNSIKKSDTLSKTPNYGKVFATAKQYAENKAGKESTFNQPDFKVSPHGKVFSSGKEYSDYKEGKPIKPVERTAGEFPSYGKVILKSSENTERLASLLTKGHTRTLEKMSRPRITFPKFSEINTRPDQNVQLLEEPRHVKMFGRKVANQQIRDFENKKNKKLNPVIKEKEMNRLSGKAERNFGRNTLGLNYSLENRDISSALAGKARSKHEAPDDLYTQKVKENTDKYNEAKLKYYDDMDKWRKEAEQFHSGSTAYWNHIASRPKLPSKPRKPTKKKVETKNLTPEQMKARGQAVDSTIEHEALHSTLGQINRKFGPVVYNEIRDKLLSHYKPDTLNALANWVEGSRGYKRNSSSFKEELLTHARDLLVNADKRKDFKNYLSKKIGINSENYYNEHMKNLKQGHQKAYEWAQNLSPEGLTSAVPGYGQLKVAADKNK